MTDAEQELIARALDIPDGSLAYPREFFEARRLVLEERLGRMEPRWEMELQAAWRMREDARRAYNSVKRKYLLQGVGRRIEELEELWKGQLSG